MKNSSIPSAGPSFICENLTFISQIRDTPSLTEPFKVIALLIFILGVIGNIATVIIISSWKKLHTPTFTMIACLALSDSFSLLQIKLRIFTNYDSILWHCYKLKLEHLQVINDMMVFMGRLGAGTQLMLLASLRYCALVYPIHFNIKCTPRKVIITSACASVLLLIFGIFSGLLNAEVFFTFRRQLVFYACVNILNCVVPASVFLTLHILKVRALRQSPSQNDTISMRMNIVISFVLVVYVISSASYAIHNTISIFNWNIPLAMEQLTNLSFLINCAANPFIYFLSSPYVIQLFLRIGQCHFRK